MDRYDAIIVGGGPAGATAATVAARNGLRVLLVDRSTFPRDKICGDAVSGKSVTILRRLGVLDTIATGESLGSWGVTFSAPGGSEVPIPFGKTSDRSFAPGFVSSREVFDNILFGCARQAGAEVREGTEVVGLLRDDNRVTGVKTRAAGCTREVGVSASLVIGADGAYSVVARDLGMTQLVPDHYAGGLRAYYEGVTGFHPGHYIELHFVEEAIPGYFWIFPMSNGRANVGVALLSSIIRKKRVRLQALLEDLVRHPRFSHRFSGARRVGPVRGWGLPLGSRPRALAGDGWMLTGDAGSLIDPFTGEGIGNAMVSGWYAGECAADAVAAGDFSRRMFSDYETRLMGRLKREFRLSHTMQQLARRRWLLDAVIGKASRSTELAETISCMFDDLSERQKLVSPLFYLRMLAA